MASRLLKQAQPYLVVSLESGVQPFAKFLAISFQAPKQVTARHFPPEVSEPRKLSLTMPAGSGAATATIASESSFGASCLAVL